MKQFIPFSNAFDYNQVTILIYLTNVNIKQEEEAITVYRKIIGTLFCIFLLTFTAAPITGINISPNIKIDEIEKYLPTTLEENETHKMGFWTHGPHRRFISEITLLNGSEKDLLKLKIILRRNILPRILPVTDVLVFGGLDFTVEYKRSLILENIKDKRGNSLGNFSPFFYWTSFEEITDGNRTNKTVFFNTKHTVKVEDFTGVIMVTKRFLYMPPHFFIIGTCEKVTLLSSS